MLNYSKTNLLWRYFEVNNNESPRPQNFRSALGGYNKEDVNRFIKETDLANSAKEQEFAAKLSALEEERDALNAAKAALEEELKAARELNDANEKKLAEQSAELEKKTAEILSQNTEIKDLQKHIGIYKDQADAQNVMIENLKKEAAEAKDKLSEADAQLDNAKASLAELEELKASLDEYKQKFVQAEAECADLRQQCAEAEEALHCFRTELENAVQQEKERAEREINTMRESIAAENENASYKPEMYDKISAQIGDILLNANRNADDILAAAKEDAEKIRADAAVEAETLRNDTYAEVTKIRSDTESEANYIRERLSDTANQLLSQISSDMHVNIDNCIKEVNTCIQEMQYDTEHMLSVLKNRYREMNERIQYYQTCVTDAVGQKLHDMDEKYGIRQETICSDTPSEE